MGYILTLDAPKTIGTKHYDEPNLETNEVRIKTLYSGISTGTELTAYRGSNPYLHQQWDEHRRLFTNQKSTWSYPMNAIGYEEVGEVVEIGSGVDKVAVGQIIWGVWGHKSSHIADQDWASIRVLPSNLAPVNGIYSQMGAIALNAVLDASARIGETVAVFGQGVPGMMVTQFLVASGVDVIAVDRDNNRLQRALACGAKFAINSAEKDAGETIKALTDNRGADVCIEIAGAYGALHDAIRSAAYNAKVVVSGFFQGDGINLRLGEEFHHNRVNLVCSQISGLACDLDHRWNRFRLDTTVMKLMSDGKVDFEGLISHEFDAKDAQAAFQLLDENTADTMQVVLKYS